jgi:hypothetical protein
MSDKKIDKKVNKVVNAANKPEKNIEINKSKKLPAAVRKIVWNTYIGKDNIIGNCLVCSSEDISYNNFECGHIISRLNGGEDTIDNLRPICGHCNKSIGCSNMDEFMDKYKIKQPDNWNGYKNNNISEEQYIEKPKKALKKIICKKEKKLEEVIIPVEYTTKSTLLKFEFTKNIYKIAHICCCGGICSDECKLMKRNILYYKLVDEFENSNKIGVFPVCPFSKNEITNTFSIDQNDWLTYIINIRTYSSDIIDKYYSNIFEIFKGQNEDLEKLKLKKINSDISHRLEFLTHLLGDNPIYKGVINKYIMNYYLNFITMNYYINDVTFNLNYSTIQIIFEVDKSKKIFSNMKLYYTNNVADTKDIAYKKILFQDNENLIWIYQL